MKAFILVLCITNLISFSYGAINEYGESSDNAFLRQIVSFFGTCSDSANIVECLGTKFVMVLNRAARSNDIEIVPGVTFARREDNDARSIHLLTDNDILSTIDNESENKFDSLAYLAMETGTQFLRTHELKFRLPAESDARISRALFEGKFENAYNA